MAPLRGPKLWEGSGCCFRCRVGFRGFVFLLCVEGEWVVSAEWSCCYNEIVDEIVIVHTRHLNLSISPSLPLFKILHYQLLKFSLD